MDNSFLDPIKPFSLPKIWVWLSILVSVLVTITSLFGILYEKTYSRDMDAWAIQAIGQDCANLAVVIILLASTYYTAKQSLRGFLVWLGAYMYLIYAFAIYAFAVNFNFLFLAYVIILGLSFYTLVAGFLAVDTASLRKLLLANKRAGMVGGLLAIIGVMFTLLWLSEIIPNTLAGTLPKSLAETGLLTNPVYVLDLAILLPAMVITAILIRRKNVIGSLLGVPLLVFSVTMGLGIFILMVISASRGLSYSLPAGIIVGLIILLSAYFSLLYLKEIK